MTAGINEVTTEKGKGFSARQAFAGLVIVLLVSAPCWGQSELKGRVLDATGASIPNASVTAYSAEQVVAQTQTRNSGDFSLSLPPGSYRLEIRSLNFETYSEAVEVKTGMPPLVVTLHIAPVQQSLEVAEEPYTLALEEDRNPGVLVLDEEFLENLPDDETELAEILRELAGPASGGGGEAEFIVDGLSSENLPPKDQILEVRINNSPFGAEYARPGRNRIQIVTRPGTGQLRGNIGFGFRDESLNARQALADVKPPYQQRNLRANVSGPLLQNQLSFSLFAMRSDRETSDTVQAILPGGLFSESVVIPSENRRYDARLQYRVSEKNTLDFRTEFGSGRRQNQGIGGFTLPERASESESREWEFRTQETAVLSSNLLNNAQFEFSRNSSSAQPLTVARAVNVLDAFRAGGDPNFNERKTHSYQFNNTLSYTRTNLTMKGGLQANYRQYATRSEDNFRGTFVFPDVDAFLAARPITFSMNTGNPRLDFNQLELALFLQNDWRATQKLQFSFGVRYAAQTNIGDANNFAPRASFAYALNRGTVLRGGLGLFPQPLSAGTVESLLRLDGTRQLQTVIRFPSYPDPFVGRGEQVLLPPSVRTSAPDLALPYTANSSLSLEKRLPHGMTLSTTYEFVRGIHLYRSRNVNAPLPGELLRPDPSRGNIELLESTGFSTYHALHVQFNRRAGAFFFFGNYTLSFNHNDTEGAFSLPANNYDLRSEWGRASSDQRHQLTTGLSTRLPWNLNSNLRMRANSGQPFNITTGFDDNNDTVTNDRPPGVPRNSGQGPGLFDVSLNLTKTITLRSNAGLALGRNALPQRGPGGWPGGGGGPMGGGV
ncbi:MAG: TonB-dependent receptor, partial [Acidobacteria bacterium]|nr:TonB-dependent receptor [Acidobacteriota bacterium]